jgi:hypothetical protein
MPSVSRWKWTAIVCSSFAVAGGLVSLQRGDDMGELAGRLGVLATAVGLVSAGRYIDLLLGVRR